MLTPAKASDTAIASFQAKPGELLNRYPTGGPALSNEVRRLAASEIGTVGGLIALAKDAKPEHIVGLGIGLAQAAAICTKSNSELADQIKKLIAESENKALAAAFSAESSIFAFAGEECLPEANRLGMGEPPDETALPTSDEEQVPPPSNTEGPQDISAKLGFGNSGFLFPYTPGDTQTRRKLPSVLGGGGLVATTGDVISPTK